MNFPWKGKKVLVAGLGLLGGGVGVAKFFAQNGAKVTVTDLKTEKELARSLVKLKNFKIRYVLGGHNFKDFKNCDLIIRNPAMRSDSVYLKVANSAKIPILMESSIFFQLTPYKNILAVTGTKGKTTTSLLVGEILREKYPVVVAGNLQISMLELLPKITSQTLVVLELSSWQLEGLETIKKSPHLAVITNIMPDHLDRYSNFNQYIKTKKIIFKFQNRQDILILNRENKLTYGFKKFAKSKVYFFSKKQLLPKIVKNFKLEGSHNLENLAAAYCTAKILSVPEDKILLAISKFQPIANRLEMIGEIGGVNFINDTTATTPEATIAAVRTISAPIILIAGGADKKLDYFNLASLINSQVKALVLLEGSATDKIEKEVKKEKIIGRFSDFKTAIDQALKQAVSGDVILLSPAAASFGMFKNEFDRGSQFRKIVKDLMIEKWQN